MNLKLAGTAALIAATSVIFAAPDAFDKYAANIAILQAKPVQTELKVSTTQRTNLNKHAKWFEDEQKKIRAKLDPKKPVPESAQKSLAALLNKFKDKIVGELSAVQLKRLREISLQSMGHTALLDSEVSKKVGLSQTQLTKLRNAYESMMKKVTDEQTKVYKPINDKYAKKNPTSEAEKKKVRDAYIAEIQAADKKLEPIVKKLAANYKATLDATMLADQKKKWSALQGKKFNLPSAG